MHRQRLVFAAILLAIVAVAGAWLVPVEAAGTTDPRLAGYPEFRIRLTDYRIESPKTVLPGAAVLVQEQHGTGVGHAFVLRIADDVAEDAIAAALAEPPAVETVPDWFWRAEFFGNGDRAVAGTPGIALVDLTPGRYLVGDPYRPKTDYARFTVSDDLVTGALQRVEPEIDITAALFEMGFRLPETAPAGHQLWKITSTDAMQNEIAIFPVPAGATREQIETAIAAELDGERGGDPAAASATIDALGAPWRGRFSRLVAGVGAISPQRESIAQFTLPPGAYSAVCYIPLAADGRPHLMLGMSAVFTVSEWTPYPLPRKERSESCVTFPKRSP